MRRNIRISLGLAAGCLAFLSGAGLAFAVTDDQPDSAAPANPYSVIVDRNIFRLNPPPPPPDPNADVKPAELPQYKLTGIVNLSGETRVFFALTPKDAKEAPTYLNLAPGERQGQLELVSIDRDKEEVAVINSGTPMTLSVKSNSFASSGGAPGAPAGPGPEGRRRLPGFPAPPMPAPVPAPAQAAAPSTGGAVIIGGGGNSGGDSGGYAQNAGVPSGNDYTPSSGIYTGGGGSSGVSVSGNAPANIGAPGIGGATIATPNGSVALNLNGISPSQSVVDAAPEASSPTEQAAALLAAEEGVDSGNKQGPPSPLSAKNGSSPPVPTK